MSEDAMKTREPRRLVRRARGAAIVAWLAMGVAACDVPTALPRFQNTLALPGPDVLIPVTGTSTPAAPVTVDLSNVDASFAERAQGGEIEFRPLNPQAGTGTLQVATSDGVARGAALIESGYGATAALGAGTVRVEAA